MAHHEAAMVGPQEVDAQLGAEVVIEGEKHDAEEQIEALVREEHTLTFRDVCRQYPKIVWWSFFWCMSAVACKSLAPRTMYCRLTVWQGASRCQSTMQSSAFLPSAHTSGKQCIIPFHDCHADRN